MYYFYLRVKLSITNQLLTGPLLNDIATTLKLVAVGSSKRKMSIYASHDLTIVSIRRALGFDDVTFKPGLGAALVVELHMVNNEPFVEVILKSFVFSNWFGWKFLSKWLVSILPSFNKGV